MFSTVTRTGWNIAYILSALLVALMTVVEGVDSLSQANQARRRTELLKSAPVVTLSALSSTPPKGRVRVEGTAEGHNDLVLPNGKRVAFEELVVTHRNPKGSDYSDVVDYDYIVPGKINLRADGQSLLTHVATASSRYFHKLGQEEIAADGQIPTPLLPLLLPKNFKDAPLKKYHEITLYTLYADEKVIACGVVVRNDKGVLMLDSPHDKVPFVVSAQDWKEVLSTVGGSQWEDRIFGWALVGCFPVSIVLTIIVPKLRKRRRKRSIVHHYSN